MKINKSTYYSLSLLALLTMGASCQKDIVKYDDNYDNQLTSNGAPSVQMISTVTDLNTAITAGELTQMIVLQGDNLAQVKSIRFNDVEVDLKTIYAVRSRITLAVPRAVPVVVNNKITVETEKGSTEFPFEVKIPNLIIDGFFNEFASAGDTTIVLGKYMDLYKLNETDGQFMFNSTSIKPFRATSDSLYFVVPTGVPEGAVMTLASDLVETPKSIRYRDRGLPIVDMNNLSDFITDGTAPGDPKPLPNFSRFIRFHQSSGAWSWNQFFWTSFDMEDAQIVANPKDYEVHFEINTKTTAPISVGNFIMDGGRSQMRWNLAANGSFNTYGKWKTVRHPLIEFFKDEGQTNGSYLQMGLNNFVFVFQPTAETNDDFSIVNIRIVKK